MYNESSQSQRCQTPQNDSLNTPEQLRAGTTSGPPRPYNTRDEWQQQHTYRSPTYANNLESRRELSPPLTHDLCNLPEEQLADMSPPIFETTCEVEATPSPAENTHNSYVNSLYKEIVSRFDEIRERIARADHKLQQESSHASPNPSVQIPNEVSEVCTSQNKNSTQTTLRKVTTRRDQCGNVTSRVEETSTVSNGRLPSPEIGRQINFMLDQSENIADVSMPMYFNDSMPAMSTRLAPQGMTSECLADTSAPPFSDTAETERRYQLPSRSQAQSIGTNVCTEEAPPFVQSTLTRPGCPAVQDICETTAPSLVGSTAIECLDNVTMPTFADVSGVPNRQTTQFPSECLEDETAPSFGRSQSYRQQPTATATNQCLEEMSMPSFGGVSGATNQMRQQQRTMPSQNICDISAPSFGTSGTDTQPYLEDMSMPTFGGVSGARNQTRQQQNSMPSQNICDTSGSPTQHNLEDMTLPSFGGVSGARYQTRQQQISLPSQNICDTSAPSFGTSGTATQPYLEDMSMPTFGGVSGARNQTRQQRSMPSQNICDTSAPSFGTSGTATQPYLEDMSMPNFGGVSGARSPQRQQQTMPRQQICETSTPARVETRTNECLENITMPSFEGVSGSSGQQAVCLENSAQSGYGIRELGPISNECLENITMPSYGETLESSRMQQSVPVECGELVTTPNTSRVASRRQQDMSMSPQNIYQSTSYYARPGTMPSECLEDVSAPTFERSMSPSRSPRRLSRSQPTQNICDITAPSFGSPSRGARTNSCLEDVTMPSFGEVSGAARAGVSRRQQRSMATQNNCEGSTPTRREITTNECLEDVTMPSFGGVSGAARRQTNYANCPIASTMYEGNNPYASRSMTQESLGQAIMPREYLEDVTPPTFGRSRSTRRQQTGPSSRQTTQPCLQDMTMPSFGGVSGARNQTRQQQQRSMPRQQLCEASAQSRREARTNECLENITMPSFGGVSGTARRQHTMPRECLDDITQPSFARSMSRPQDPSTSPFYVVSGNACLEDVTMPSMVAVEDVSANFARSMARSRSVRQPQRTNICNTTSFGNPTRGQATNQCLEDLTLPSFGGVSGARNPTRQQRTMPSQNICDISAPSFGTSGTATQPYLEEMSMPTFGGVSGARNPTRQQQNSMPSQNICDISAPSFGPSGTATQPYLEDLTLPSFGGVSGARNPTRQQRTMPSQNICDISAPTFGTSGTATQPYLEDMSMPTFGGVSGVSKARNASRQQQSMHRQNICDTSAPSFANSGRRTMNTQYLDDVTMPSYPERSLSQGASPRRQPRTRNMCDISAPQYYSSGRSTMNNRTMPPFGVKSGAWREATMPEEYLGEISAPFQSRTQNTQEIWNISPPDFSNCNNYSRRPHSEPTYPSECLDEVTAPGSPFMTRAYLQETTMPSTRRVRSFPCIPSEQQICDISAPSMSEIYISIQDTRAVNRGVETSYPNEMQANVSLPFYRNMSRSGGFNQTNRPNVSSMPCENLEDISEPMFANSTSRANPTTTSRARSRPVEQLDDISMPSMEASTGRGLRNNFARSTAIGDVDGKLANTDPPCQCPAAQENSKDTSGAQAVDTAKSTGSVKQSNSSQNLSNECEPSALNNTTQGPVSDVTEVKEVTIIASVSSMKRVYTKKNASDAQDNSQRSRDRNQKIYHSVGNYTNLNDVSMPTFESTGTGNATHRNDISTPTYGPSLESVYSTTYCGPRTNENYPDFSPMGNYAPQTLGIRVFPPLSTPEPVRGNNTPKTGSSYRSNTPTDMRGKCCCSNKNCQRNRKERRAARGHDASGAC